MGCGVVPVACEIALKKASVAPTRRGESAAFTAEHPGPIRLDHATGFANCGLALRTWAVTAREGRYIQNVILIRQQTEKNPGSFFVN